LDAGATLACWLPDVAADDEFETLVEAVAAADVPDGEEALDDFEEQALETRSARTAAAAIFAMPAG
jgi:hypothetical protein